MSRRENCQLAVSGKVERLATLAARMITKLILLVIIKEKQVIAILGCAPFPADVALLAVLPVKCLSLPYTAMMSLELVF